MLSSAALVAAAQPAPSSAPSSGPPAQARPASAAAPGAPERAASLAELVERAWSLSRRQRLGDARAQEIDARGIANRALFAGSPSVGLDLRRDLPRWATLPGTDASDERGKNEIEPAVSAPIWLPGQRDAQRRVLDRERELLESATRAERLRLAGEVREAAWALSIAQSEDRLQRARFEAARALEADVARRVGAGDLAPADRLLAQAELLSAEAAAREAQARVGAARASLGALSGMDAVGDIAERPVNDADPDAHPELMAAREAADVGRSKLELAQATRRDNPTVSMAARFDRDVYGNPYRNLLRIGISLPLDTEARNAPRLAAASVQLAEAEIALERRQRELAAGIERARLALDAAREVHETQSRRAAVAVEAQGALERAFRAGERGLPDVLRIRAQAFEAELARDIARERLGQAVARFNQAHGVQP